MFESTHAARQHALQYAVAKDEIVIDRRANMHGNEPEQKPGERRMNVAREVTDSRFRRKQGRQLDDAVSRW